MIVEYVRMIWACIVVSTLFDRRLMKQEHLASDGWNCWEGSVSGRYLHQWYRYQSLYTKGGQENS